MTPEQRYEQILSEVISTWLPNWPQDYISDIGVICGLYPYINTCETSELAQKTQEHWNKLNGSAEYDLLTLFNAYTQIDTWTDPHDEDFVMIQSFIELLNAICASEDYQTWLKTDYAPRAYLLDLRGTDDEPLYCQYYQKPLAPAWEYMIIRCYQRLLLTNWID